MIKHKKHATKRETVCGIEYDDMMEVKNYNLEKFLNRLAGHWRRVTCKNCHKKRDYYEKRQNRRPST